MSCITQGHNTVPAVSLDPSISSLNTLPTEPLHSIKVNLDFNSTVT